MLAYERVRSNYGILSTSARLRVSTNNDNNLYKCTTNECEKFTKKNSRAIMKLLFEHGACNSRICIL